MAKMLRDAAYIKSFLQELPTGQLFTTKACRIQIPTRYKDRDIAVIGLDTYIYGIFAIISEENKYAVSNVTALMKILPYKTLEIEVEGVPYYEFHFEANSVIVETLDLVKKDILIYNVLDEFIFKGKIPWFLNYEDVAKLFDSSQDFAGSNVAQSPETLELIASMVARNPKDRLQYYRTVVQSYDDLMTHPPDFVPLMSVYYSATNTLNKLAGRDYNDGVVSALVTPTEKIQRIEQLVRA